MISKDRREAILKLLIESNSPIKGTILAQKFGVTRQVIVKDIAILRAKNSNIISTQDGYMFNNINGWRVRRIIAVSHNEKNTIDELEIVVKYGGIIEDVIVEHPIYGEIKVNLMIKNLNDLNKFKENFTDNNITPLSALTNGIHIHTISADSQENIDYIIRDLRQKGYLL